MPAFHASNPSGSPPGDVYRQCVETSPYGIRSTDPEGRIVLFNPRLIDITGYRPEEIPDIDTWCEKVYPDARYRRLVLWFRDQIWACPPPGVGAEVVQNKHAMITRKDGRIRNCRIRITFAPSGLRTAFIRDTHEPQPGGTDTLHSSAVPSETLRPFFSWVRGPEGAFLLFGYNRAAETWAGRSLSASLACPVGELFQDPEGIETELRRCLANRTGVWRKGNFRLRHHSDATYASAAYGFDPPCIVTVQLEDLSDLMRAENSLRQSEQRFSELADLFPDIVYEIDPAGRIAYLNRNGAVLMGFEPDNYPKGDIAFNYFAPEDQERVRQNFTRVFSGEELPPNEYVMLRRDGTRFDAFLRSSLVRKDGKVIGARGFIVDISARKQAEHALEASERKFAVSIQNTPNAFGVIRLRDGVILDANEAACKLYGFTREEVIGHTSQELGTWADPRQRAEVMAALQENQSIRNFPTLFRCKSGEIRHGLYFASRVRIDGELCLLSEVLDVTELHKVEEALRVSEERLRTATEAAMVGLWDWDIERQTVYCNRVYYEMLGYSFGDFTPSYETWLDMVHPDDRPAAAEKAQGCLVGGNGFFSAEYRMRARNGSFIWIQDCGRVAQRDAHGRPTRALGIHLDITERKHLEQCLKQSHEELEGRVAERTAQLTTANRKLKQQIQKRLAVVNELRASEQLLRQQREDLTDTNAALRVLLKKRDEDRRDIEKKTVAHVTRTVMPYLDKLKQQRLAPGSRECLKAIEGNLNGLAASSVRKLSDDLIDLTPAELQVAGLIMMDKATKEIAEDLNLSPKTVEYHRYNLRRKLGLGKRKVNLRTYLKTIK